MNEKNQQIQTKQAVIQEFQRELAIAQSRILDPFAFLETSYQRMATIQKAT